MTSWARRLASADRRVQGLAAFLLYVFVDAAIWGWHVLGRLGSSYVGFGHADATLYSWVLTWWPYAISHGLNPLFTRMAWAPGGADMAWVTCLPGPGLAMAPVTVTVGPIVSSNILALLAPPLAGWAAYLLCRRASGRFWPSVAGGYLFGLSTYMVNQMQGHLNLVLIFPVPLAVYLVLRWLDGDLGRGPFVLLLAATFVAEFSISIEVFATLTLFGGLTLGGALLLGGAECRRRMCSVLPWIAGSYALALVVLSPYLYFALTNVPAGPLRHLDKASVDLAGFILPRQFTLLGGTTLQNFTSAFRPNNAEDGSYLGLLLVAVVLLFAWRERRSRARLLLALLLLVCVVASLGPVLHIHGRPVIALPWSVVARLPILQDALPERLTAYMWLVVAVIVALWLSRSDRAKWGRWAKWGLVALAAVAILPATPSPPFFPNVIVPTFFTGGAYREYLARGEVVLPIPFARGTSMQWQTQADMYFRQAGAYLGPVPPQYTSDPTIRALQMNEPQVIDPKAFSLFVAHSQIGAVVVAPGYLHTWAMLLQNLGVEPEHVGGVTLYRLQATPGHPALPAAGVVYSGDLRRGGKLESFSLPALIGKGTVTYGRFAGKPLVIQFFASWCKDCLMGLRTLVHVHGALGHRVGFLAVAQSDRTEEARALVRKAKVTFPTASDPLGRFFGGFHGTTMPLTVFVGPHGEIRAIETAPLATKRLEALIRSVFHPRPA